MYHPQTPSTIQEMFSSIAHRYDLGNTLLSLGMHKGWKKRLVKIASQQASTHHPTWLDLCSGTGDVAIAHLATTTSKAPVYLLDFCKDMLDIAEKKINAQGLANSNTHFLQADAMALPLQDASCDIITIAYGIRNVKNPQECLQEGYRVLRPGGVFAILEHSLPKKKLLAALHKTYLAHVVPRIGRWLTGNASAYQYLSNSIETFATPESLEHSLQKAGFAKTQRLPLVGGVSTITLGVKPHPAVI